MLERVLVAVGNPSMERALHVLHVLPPCSAARHSDSIRCEQRDLIVVPPLRRRDEHHTKLSDLCYTMTAIHRSTEDRTPSWPWSPNIVCPER